jgi:hypothetical protein
MTPAAHFAKFCETLTQSEDRWEARAGLVRDSLPDHSGGGSTT